MYPESIKAKLFFPIAWLWTVAVFLVVSDIFAGVTLVTGNIERDKQAATIVANQETIQENQAKIQKILDERTPLLKDMQERINDIETKMGLQRKR